MCLCVLLSCLPCPSVVSLAAKLLIEQFSIGGEAYCVARQTIILKISAKFL
jgi:hypothetical protein